MLLEAILAIAEARIMVEKTAANSEPVQKLGSGRPDVNCSTRRGGLPPARPPDAAHGRRHEIAPRATEIECTHFQPMASSIAGPGWAQAALHR